MPQLQSVFNFAVLAATVLCLYYISVRIEQETDQNSTVIDLTTRIAQGQQLKDLTILKKVLKEAKIQEYDQSPLCLLRAYNSIVVEHQVDSGNLFYLFQQSKFEYDGMKTCSHYYSLLLSRAHILQLQQKDRIINLLTSLQRQRYNGMYHKGQNQVHICVHLYTHNAEKSIKQQIDKIVQQKYDNFGVLIQDDASTDNTAILAEYTLDHTQPKYKQKINVSHTSEQSGFLHGFEYFLRQNCGQDSVVLMLNSSQILIGANSFELINGVFSQLGTRIAFFKILQSEHLNVEDNHVMISGSIKPISPILAFRKEEYAKIAGLLKDKVNSTEYRGVERELISYYLVKSQTDESAIKIVDEVMVVASQNNHVAHQQRLTDLINELFDF